MGDKVMERYKLPRGQSTSGKLDSKATQLETEAQHSKDEGAARVKQSQAGAIKRMANLRRDMDQ